jgi:IS5 family transposase
MRGDDEQQMGVFRYVSPEQCVPMNHPLRPLRAMADEALRELFRWFVGLNLDDPIWDATVFTKNRQRLLDGEIAEAFFAAVLQQARQRDLLSDEHFTVEGTLLEAWAGQKSLRRVDGNQAPPAAGTGEGSNPTVNFHGEKRSNQTHCPTTAPEALLARQSRGTGAVLAYRGHRLTENRNGLVVAALATHADGSAERDAARRMAESLPGTHRVTLGADKGYDTRDFVAELRGMQITPHVAQNAPHRRSAVDERTTRYFGYQLSPRARKRIEEVFGWRKTVGSCAKYGTAEGIASAGCFP